MAKDDNKTIAPPPKSLLPPDTAKLYKLVNWRGGTVQVFGKFGQINISTLSIQQAERLVKSKFSKIARK